jgi:hypothetical protein
MDIIDHGDWIPYEPEEGLSVLGYKVAFCKRLADDADWYHYLRQELHDNPSVKVTLRKQDDSWVVSTTATDASMLFPVNHKLIELIRYEGDHKQFRGQRFDFDKREFLPPLPLKVDPQFVAKLKDIINKEPSSWQT